MGKNKKGSEENIEKKENLGEVKEELQSDNNADENVKIKDASRPCSSEEYDKLKNEFDLLNDKYLRLYSEFENFRRRTNKEKLEIIDYANQRLIVDLLPILDDFDRAFKASEEFNEETREKIKGFELISSKFSKILTDKGLKEIEVLEQNFDTDLHEAITQVPAPNKKLKGKVIDQIEKGYFLNSKVIRHSKVVIGK